MSRKEKISLQLPVNYKPQEIAELAIEAARIRRDIGEAEKEKAAVDKKLNKRIKELANQLFPVDASILDGFTLEDVECEASFDGQDMITKVTRCDTKEEVTGVQQVRLNLPMADQAEGLIPPDNSDATGNNDADQGEEDSPDRTMTDGEVNPSGESAPDPKASVAGKQGKGKRKGPAPKDPSKPLSGKKLSDGHPGPKTGSKPGQGKNSHSAAPPKPGAQSRPQILKDKCTVCGSTKVENPDGTIHCMRVPKHTEMENLR